MKTLHSLDDYEYTLFILQSCSVAALLQLEWGQATLVKTDSLPTLVALTTRVLLD